MAASFDQLMDETTWRTSLTKLGMDVTMVSSKPLYSTMTEAAREKEIHLRLRNGEKLKFQRRGKTDKSTMVTLTGDQIIADIIRNNMALLPIAISAHGQFGSLFKRFLYGEDPLPSPNFADGRINAEAVEKIARSAKVSRGVLKRANDIWRCTNPDSSYSGSYKAMDPLTHYNQQMGLIISTSISSHLLRAHEKKQIQTTPIMQMQCQLQMR